MGDWARGEFAAAGMTGVKDFGCMIGLNEDKPVVSTDGDIILFFKQDDPEVEAAQKRLASLLISPRSRSPSTTPRAPCRCATTSTCRRPIRACRRR